MKFLTFAFSILWAIPVLAGDKVRIGWQIPWTLQGQLVQVLKHTPILKNNGLEAEFVGRTYGPELNEAALAGALDVILTADQPAAVLFTRSSEWRGIGRLMYNRTTTYVPPASPIRKVEGLKGKTVGVPFGAAAERIVHEAVDQAGLGKEEVKFVNLGILEQPPLVMRAKKNGRTWDQFDALSGFDPVPAILEAKGLARTIHTGKVCSLILLRKQSEDKDKRIALALLRSFREAYAYYRDNTVQVNRWFLEESGLKDADDKALELASSLEPNLSGKKIRLSFTEEDFSLMQKGADFASRLTGKTISMKDFVTNEFAGSL